MKKKRVIVGMSGGVDSSVSALLLKEAGYEVTGVFMKNWEDQGPSNVCEAARDFEDALAVSEKLGIELTEVNFTEEYWESVFTYFLQDYKEGRTPNPDILCNKEIKFKAFLHLAKQRGSDYIAMGHYARTRKEDKQFYLLKGKDAHKDQSYFLYALSQGQLADSLFPIGDLDKSTVRSLAKKAGFINFAKKDSTGICFIGERRFNQFLSQYLPSKPGNIETLDGKVIGRHEGLIFYTLGQRKGLQIGGIKNFEEAPWYVVAKELATNTLRVVQGKNHPALFSKKMRVCALHWINDEPPRALNPLSAKIRYRQADQVCALLSIDHDQGEVEFRIPQWAATAGQSIVFYQGDVCLGGGIISELLA